MPLGELSGIAPGCRVVPERTPLSVRCCDELLGKVVDGLGNTIDGTTISGGVQYSLDSEPPNPLKRKRIKEVIPTGIRAIDGFLTCGEGQRVGIFAGSGVGKSTTLGMIAKYAEADVNVIALIGERGREVRDVYSKKTLEKKVCKKSIIVCATSDKPALVRLNGGSLQLQQLQNTLEIKVKKNFDDGFCYKICHGAERNRTGNRRTSGNQGIYSFCICKTSKTYGKSWNV